MKELGMRLPGPKGALRMLIMAAGLAMVSGCVLAPPGTSEERQKLAAQGKNYETPVEKRSLGELPSPSTWQDVLQRGFLANGDLEAAYFDWKAAVERINMSAAWPNSNVALSFSYMFSPGRMKSWDRTTISASPDPAMSLSLPVKTIAAGKVALENARAAGHRFRTVKFDLQKRLLTSYLDIALIDEKIRIQADNVALLKMLSETATNRMQAGGGPQQDMLKAQIEWRLAENALSNLQSEASTMRAMLNGMLARDAAAPLALPSRLPEARTVGADDAKLIAAAVDQNPELAGLARQVAGRGDALELARLAYLPDINPQAGFTGGVSQFVGAMIMLPTTIPMIEAQIQESHAMLRSMQAMARQTRHERGASFVATLYAMRNAERQVALFGQRIGPLAEQLLSSSRQAYAAGRVGFTELIDSQRTLLQVRLMVAEARVDREKRLAELESLAGVDVEMIGK